MKENYIHRHYDIDTRRGKFFLISIGMYCLYFCNRTFCFNFKKEKHVKFCVSIVLNQLSWSLVASSKCVRQRYRPGIHWYQLSSAYLRSVNFENIFIKLSFASVLISLWVSPGPARGVFELFPRTGHQNFGGANHFGRECIGTGKIV